MFKQKQKRIDKLESTIHLMSLYLDAYLCTSRDEITFNKKVIEVCKDDERIGEIQKQVEIESRIYERLLRLRKDYKLLMKEGLS